MRWIKFDSSPFNNKDYVPSKRLDEHFVHNFKTTDTWCDTCKKSTDREPNQQFVRVECNAIVRIQSTIWLFFRIVATNWISMFAMPCILIYIFFEVPKWESFQKFPTVSERNLVVYKYVCVELCLTVACSLFYTLFVMSWTCLFPRSFMDLLISEAIPISAQSLHLARALNCTLTCSSKYA